MRHTRHFLIPSRRVLLTLAVAASIAPLAQAGYILDGTTLTVPPQPSFTADGQTMLVTGTDNQFGVNNEPNYLNPTVILDTGAHLTSTQSADMPGIYLFAAGDVVIDLRQSSQITISGIQPPPTYGINQTYAGILSLANNSTISMASGSSINVDSLETTIPDYRVGIGDLGGITYISTSTPSPAMAHNVTLDGASITIDHANHAFGVDVENVLYSTSSSSPEMNAVVALSNQTSISSSGGIWATGISTFNQSKSDITLSGGSVIDTTSSADNPDSTVTESVGILADSQIVPASTSTISIDGGSEVHSTATNGSATAIGSYAATNTITVTDSTLSASAPSAGYTAIGIATLGSQSTIKLNDGRINADAATTGAGIAIGSGSATIALTNGSALDVQPDGSDGSGLTGISIGRTASADISIDATSSVTVGGAGFGIGPGATNDVPTVHVNNAGLISAQMAIQGNAAVTNSGTIDGRLDLVSLNQSASGVLQANLTASTPTFTGTGTGTPYWNVTGNATLADGSTIRITTSDQALKTDLKNNGSKQYLLLRAGTPSWNRNQLVLASSRFLRTSWVTNGVAANELVAQVNYYSCATAGLSGNGFNACQAAFEDPNVSFDPYGDPEQWTPNVSGADRNALRNAAWLLNDQVASRLHHGGPSGINTGDSELNHGLWIEGRYASAQQGRISGINGFDANTNAASIGYDISPAPAWTAGIAFSWADTSANGRGSADKVDVNGHALTLYGGWDNNAWYADATATYGRWNNDAKRYAGGQRLKAHYNSDMLGATALAGYRFDVGGWDIAPQLGADHYHINLDNYTESGGSLALHVDNQDYTITELGGGIDIQRAFAVGHGTLTPELQLMAWHDFANDRVQTTANFVGGQFAFVSNGAKPDANRYEADANLDWNITDRTSVVIGADYQHRQDFNALEGRIKLSWML